MGRLYHLRTWKPSFFEVTFLITQMELTKKKTEKVTDKTPQKGWVTTDGRTWQVPYVLPWICVSHRRQKVTVLIQFRWGRPAENSIVDNTHQFFWEAKETNRLFCCNIKPSETHKAIYRVEMTSFLVCGWTNPLEKYVRQNGFIVPNFWGENKKYLSCHHPVMFLSWTPTKNQQITSPSVKKIPILIFPTFRLATSFPSSMLKGFSNSGISQNVPSFHSSSSIIQPLLSLVSPSLPLATLDFPVQS